MGADSGLLGPILGVPGPSPGRQNTESNEPLRAGGSLTRDEAGNRQKSVSRRLRSDQVPFQEVGRAEARILKGPFAAPEAPGVRFCSASGIIPDPSLSLGCRRS